MMKDENILELKKRIFDNNKKIEMIKDSIIEILAVLDDLIENVQRIELECEKS